MNAVNGNDRALGCDPVLSGFLLEAARYYENLLHENVRRLKSLSLTYPESGGQCIGAELQSASYFRKNIEKQKAEQKDYKDDEVFYYRRSPIGDEDMQWMKSVAILYLNHMRDQRSIFTSNPSTSRYAIDDLDQWISERQTDIDTAFGGEKETPTGPLLVEADKPCLALYDKAGKRVRLKIFVNDDGNAVVGGGAVSNGG